MSTGTKAGFLLGFGASFLLSALLSGAAHATSPAEARDVAIAANCQPGKTEVLRQYTGNFGTTVFKVSCADTKEKDRFVLVQCRVKQCVLLR